MTTDSIRGDASRSGAGSEIRYRPLAVLLVAFVALASFYNISNPIFEAPDELWHYRFVDHLAKGGGLPILYEDTAMNVAGQEGGQPPLYYGIAALVASWVPSRDIASLTVLNPARRSGGGPNLLVHTAREDFPYRGGTLAVHLIRGLSTLMGATTVLLTYLAALECLRRKRPPALCAAALAALNPQFIFISSSISNDNLITLVSALALLLVLRGVVRGFPLSHAPFLGAALAAAALSKVSGLALLPLALAGLGTRAWREHSLAPFRTCFVVAPLLAAGCAWWFARNWALYGDPLGLGIFISASGGRPPPLTLGYLQTEMGRVWASYWALFGWSNVPAAPGLYAFYGALSVTGLVGLGCLMAGRSPYPSGRRPTTQACVFAMLVSWVGAYALLLAKYAGMIAGMQGRLLFPALPAVSILLAAGLSGLVPSRWARKLPAALGLSLAVPAVLAPILYIIPAYPRVTPLDDSRISAIPERVDVNYGGAIQLMGYGVTSRDLQAGEPLEITLYWRALSSPGENFTVFLHAFEPGGGELGQVDSLIGLQGFPTAAWLAGDTLQETYSMYVQEPSDKPSIVRIEAGLYRFPSMERVEASDSHSRPLGTSVPILRAKAVAAPSKPPSPGHELPLGSEIVMEGYQVGSGAAAPGGSGTRQHGVAGPSNSQEERPVGPSGEEAEMPLVPGQILEGRLWWKASQKPARDYSVFVQLVGERGLLAQHDAQPRANSYPTSVWDAGEEVEDYFRMVVPDNATPGIYRLVAGMYDPVSGERLRTFGGDYVSLGLARIAPVPE